MAHYLVQVSYTPEAWAAMVKNPQDRIAAVAPVVERVGGRIVGGWLAFGDYDIVAICDMPDNVSAAAFSMAASAGGPSRTSRRPRSCRRARRRTQCGRPAAPGTPRPRRSVTARHASPYAAFAALSS